VIRAEAAYPFSDLALARRLERTEASGNAAFVEARAELQPELGANWTEVAGAYAMFDGVGSPLTQSFGLGLFQTIGAAEMLALEGFFRDRGADVFHEVSPMADPSLLTLLNERGYQPVELTSVLIRPTAVAIDSIRPRDERIVARRIDPGEEDLWARIAAEGWGETAELSAFVREIGMVMARSKCSFCFLAELEGRPIAAAALGKADGVAVLAGASTIPAARKRGAQLALLQERLRFAAEQGCDLAMMGAQPGSTSQRNAEREGFRIVYTRIKWQLRSTGS
jgi:Acetyltransferase (GNAT) domain